MRCVAVKTSSPIAIGYSNVKKQGFSNFKEILFSSLPVLRVGVYLHKKIGE